MLQKHQVILAMSILMAFGNHACRIYQHFPLTFFNTDCERNPNMMSDTESIIKSSKYQFEKHEVNTSDGFILIMFRILPKDGAANGQSVYLMHGLFTSPVVWVFKRNKSLAFNLADRGYDVWLGSIRGTSLSKSNQVYNNSDPRYWSFDLDTVAQKDVPAQLNYIETRTKVKGSTIFIGYSMGASLGLIYASEHPQNASALLSGIAALAPGAYMEDIPLQKFGYLINFLLEHSQVGQFDPDTSKTRSANAFTCSTIPSLCKMLFGAVFGTLTDKFKNEDLMLYASNFPEGTSVQLLRHYVQMLQSGEFRKYDYGRQRNLMKYDTYKAPGYDLKKVEVPVVLFYGNNDNIATEKNVKRLYREIGSNAKIIQHIPKDNKQQGFNHLDFIMAADIKEHLFNDLFALLKSMFKPKRTSFFF